MKKFIYIVVVLCMFLCTSCTVPRNDYDKFDYDVFERPGIMYYMEKEEDAIVLLMDYSSYREYVDRISEKEMGKEVHEALNSFDTDFFEDEMLVVIVYEARSGMSKLSIMDIVYDESNIEVVLCCDYPGDGAMTDDMKDYAVLLRIPNNETYMTVEYSVVDKYELPGKYFSN